MDGLIKLPVNISAPLIFDEETNMDDSKFMYYLKGVMSDVIIENRIYYDGDDIIEAIDLMYPIIHIIVFSPHCRLRYDAKGIKKLVTFILVNYA